MTTSLSITTFAQAWSGHHDGDDWGWMVLMMLFMLLFWATVIGGIVWAIRHWSQGLPTGRSTESPEEVLARGLADGTFTVEEYERRRAVLGGRHEAGSGNGPAASSP